MPPPLTKKLLEKPAPFAAVLVLLLVLLLYLPALRCGFVHIDDPEYVLGNPLIRQLDLGTFISAFTQAHVGWWMPLTWISFAIDYQIWGLNPFGYHLTNILLHGVNASLVVLIADSLLKGRVVASREESGYLYPAMLLFAGLFFGIHPLRVESVAWVTERKDVLNGLFFFGAILFYLGFARRKQLNPSRTGYGVCYLLSFLCFILSLMAKSTSVVLPVMLLMLDWYPLGRLDRNNFGPVLLEKVPFFAVSAAMAAITLMTTASSRYLVTYEAFPFAQRLVVSGNAVWEYFRLLLFPYNLNPFNVIPDPIPAVYTLTSLLVAAVFLCIGFAARRSWLKTAAACFVLPMLPVLAFFQNGDQSFADRFTYLPSLAFSVATAGILFNLASRKGIEVRSLVLLGTGVLMVLLSIMTYRQIFVWRSTETFWTRVIKVQPIAINYKERGLYYQMNGRYDEAVADFTAALERITATLKPYEYNFYAFRAESLRAAGRFEEAVSDYTRAIVMLPHPAYFLGRGLALRSLGKGAEAEEDIRRSGTNPGPVLWFD